MASRVVTQLVSDMSGEEIADGAGDSIEFSYRGTSYAIDLTDGEAADFDAAVAPYLAVASRVGRTRRSATPRSTANGGDAKAIREWARDHGVEVPERGRIPAAVREQYESSER